MTCFYLFRTIGQHCQALKDLRLSHCTVARSIHDPVVHPAAPGEAGGRLRLFRALRHLVISSNIRLVRKQQKAGIFVKDFRYCVENFYDTITSISVEFFEHLKGVRTL